jgi:hypothetical protein
MGCAQDRSGFVSSAAPTNRWRARRAHLGVAALLVEGPTRRGRAGKVRRKASPEIEMLINDERTRNVYDNKGNDDNCPNANDDIPIQPHDILTEADGLVSVRDR